MHFSDVTMTSGARGPAVLDLQRRLTAAGFNPGVADGIWGANTTKAVVAANEKLLGRSSAVADDALLAKLPNVGKQAIVLQPITGKIDSNTGVATVDPYSPEVTGLPSVTIPPDKSLLVGGVIAVAALIFFFGDKK